MTGKELVELAKKYEDFDFQFTFTDGEYRTLNVRHFENLELCDVGYSDKVVILTGKER